MLLTTPCQHSPASSCRVRGRGYWSGRPVTVTMHPAPADHGIVLVRSDRPGRPACPARIEFAAEAPLRTNLVRGRASFQMVEHLMSALAGLGIDNCEIEIDAEELPGLDGSSLPYVEALSSAGLILQARPKRRLVIRQSYRVGNDRSFIVVSPSGDAEQRIGRDARPRSRGTSHFEYQLSYDDDTPIPPQAFGTTLDASTYIREIAAARTFVTVKQAAEIRRSGAAAHVGNQDLLIIGDAGPIENDYRFAGECARHKTLDLIGDLALSGVEIVGRITSFRGGHLLNGRMARRIAELAAVELPPVRVPGSAITPPPSVALRRAA